MYNYNVKMQSNEERVPVEIERQPLRRRQDLLKCRFCGATVQRSEVLPGGYCPVCQR